MNTEDVAALVDEIGGGSQDLSDARLEFHFATANDSGPVVEAMRAALKWPSVRADEAPPAARLQAWDELAVLVRAPAVSGRLHDLQGSP